MNTKNTPFQLCPTSAPDTAGGTPQPGVVAGGHIWKTAHEAALLGLAHVLPHGIHADAQGEGSAHQDEASKQSSQAGDERPGPQAGNGSDAAERGHEEQECTHVSTSVKDGGGDDDRSTTNRAGVALTVDAAKGDAGLRPVRANGVGLAAVRAVDGLLFGLAYNAGAGGEHSGLDLGKLNAQRFVLVGADLVDVAVPELLNGRARHLRGVGNLKNSPTRQVLQLRAERVYGRNGLIHRRIMIRLRIVLQ